MTNNYFLTKELVFTETSIINFEKNNLDVVMDICEDSLMKRTADVLVQEDDDLLEVGFGMGIFSNYAQGKKLRSHTIVEGHPQVFEKLLEWSKNKKNVEIIFGDWVDVLDKIHKKKYDCVYFDTHHDNNTLDFFKKVKNSIKQNGRFSRFGLNLNEKKILEKEFGITEMKILVNENHKVIPSENVKYIKNETIPICVIGL